MLQVHEFDELRFDIRGHECTYFLRASSVEEKDSWVEAIEGHKVRNQPKAYVPSLGSTFGCYGEGLCVCVGIKCCVLALVMFKLQRCQEIGQLWALHLAGNALSR